MTVAVVEFCQSVVWLWSETELVKTVLQYSDSEGQELTKKLLTISLTIS